MTILARFGAAALCSLVLLGTGACSDSPGAPTPAVANIGGAWTGSWMFVTAGVTVTDAVTATFTQTGTSAVGNWTAASGPGGQLTLELGTNVSGATSISQTLLNGVNCSASTTVTGTATATRVQLVLGAFPAAGLCQWATNQTLTFTR